ncbi:MAG: right-handed parallel beta-helix repeat-containing protein [Ginsengibacter sp.]
MKMLFVSSLILFVMTANATNYYISSSGNDSNSGTNESSPWQTLDKVNSFKNFVPGDNILFNRGDTFYGSITVSNAGSSYAPITFGAYGSGANPVITGFTTVTDWTNIEGDIWESTNAVSTLSTCNMVVINGVNTAMGRYPNTGYLTYQSHSGNTSITSSSLTGTPNWTGASSIIKKERWAVEAGTITAQSGGTLSFIDGGKFTPTNGFGFFIQNDPRTLDVQNEWYYNPSTKKIRVYSASSPVNVQISTVEMLAAVSGTWSYNFNNISFKGSNSDAMNLHLVSSGNISVKNCDISYAGGDGIYADRVTVDIEDNNISYSNSNGIEVTYTCPNSIIKNNTIKNTGLLPGMMMKTTSGNGIHVQGVNLLVQYNNIDSSGYDGIYFSGDNMKIRNNFINHSCMVTDDGGGIYTGGSNFGNEIVGNIILNSVGNIEGIDAGSGYMGVGIYLDSYSSNFLIQGNTVANGNSSGGFFSNLNNNVIRDNTFYNNSLLTGFNSKGEVMMQHICCNDVRSNVFNSNICFSKSSIKSPYFSYSITDDINQWGTADSNYYVSSNGGNTFGVQLNSTVTNYTLPQWRSYSGRDTHSQSLIKSPASMDGVRFEYNATQSNKTVSLDAKYVDVKGNVYNGSITLAPYTSAVLIKDGPITTNQPPLASAGGDQNITLPVNNISLSGKGTDADGTIASFLWTEISGPSSVAIGTPGSASTNMTGLIKGIYQFELTVTDNQDGVGKDTVSVTVNAAVNIPPKANAGNDRSVNLPTNTMTLTGSGSDTDGSIKDYQWTKVLGPSGFSITNATSPITDVSGLVPGIYQFELAVTDNEGGIGRDTIQVNVNAAPVASAGADRSISLPASTINLSGSGSDVDGSIKTYQWAEISGPSSYHIVNPTLALTEVSGLVQGVYQFELTVTDDKGGIGKDTVQVRVSAAANIVPTANAGSDKTITLPVSTASLTGSGSDVDGSIKSYQWTKISGPSNYNIVNASSPVTDVSGMTQGIYQFTLKVTDDKGDTGSDTVQIRVNPTPNIAPTANAGSDKIITLPTNIVTLTGSGSDVDGSVKTYLWTKISGPSGYNIINASSPVTDISNLVQGVYLFQLMVTDDRGSIGKDTVGVSVIVSQAVQSVPNNPPVAFAGNDTTVVSPISMVTLKGNGMDPDGNIIKYSWSQVSGPTTATILSNSTPATDISGLIEGTYKFVLEVTDNKGGKGKDTVSVTVALGRIAQGDYEVKVYPNPVQDITTVEMSTGKSNTSLLIMVTDMSGRIVYKRQLVSSASDVKEQINMDNLAKGTYVITVIFDGVEKRSVEVVKL